MQTADVSAAIVRASYGTERDSRVLENVATLRAAGIPVAALYHEFDPAADWPAQLDTFTEIMRQAGVERGNHPADLDPEAYVILALQMVTFTSAMGPVVSVAIEESDEGRKRYYREVARIAKAAA